MLSMFESGQVVEVVMFDLDGTLIDTMNGFADVAAAVMVELHGLDAADARRRYLATSGIPFRQQLEIICPSHVANAAAATIFEQRKRSHADRASLDGLTVQALARLRSFNIKVVISSNSEQHFVDEFVARQDLHFDLALGFDASTGFAKGRPHVEYTCKTLGVTRAQIVFCGDSLTDGELARDSGVAFVGRLGTFSLEDFQRWHPLAVAVATIQDLADLVELRAA